MHVEKVSRTVGNLINSWEHPSCDFFLKARIVGYLHDVIEDTEITIADLTRLDQITPKDLARQAKYQQAIIYLSEFTCTQCGKTLPLAEMGERQSRSGEIVCEGCLGKDEKG